MIWFDFGGVLSPPLEQTFRGYHARTGIAPGQLRSAVAAVAADLGLPPLAPIQLGLLTEAEWGRAVRRALLAAEPGIDLSRARLESFGEQWFEGMQANPVMVLTARHAKEEGHRIGILTNSVIEWERHWQAVVEPVSDFDCIVDSCKIGVRKPDPRIFRRGEEEAGVAAADCVLVDDLAENCEGARRVGWRAVHFRSNAQAVRDLESLVGLPTMA